MEKICMKRGFIIGLLLLASSLLVWYNTTLRTKKELPIFSLQTITVGTHAQYQPYTFIEDEKIVGFDIDLIQEVCSRLGVEIIFKDMPFNSLIPSLQLGEIHVAAAGLTPTQERQKLVSFTQPYLDKDPLLIISRADQQPALETLADLQGKKVIVHKDHLSDTYLSSKESLVLHRVASTEEGFNELLNKNGDAFVTASNNAQPFFIHYGQQQFHVAPIQESVNNYALAVSKKYPELLTKIQALLNDILRDGTLNRLKRKWALE